MLRLLCLLAECKGAGRSCAVLLRLCRLLLAEVKGIARSSAILLRLLRLLSKACKWVALCAAVRHWRCLLLLTKP